MNEHVDYQAIGAESLYREHARFVAAFLRRLSVLESDLDDVVQDVFAFAHRKGGYRPGPAAPRTWLAALALRFATARVRAAARGRHHGLPHDLLLISAEALPPDELLDSRRCLQRVQAALDQLPLEQRATFVSFELEGMSCEDIAELWNVRVGTVYSRLHHARKRFTKSYSRFSKRHGSADCRA